MREDAIMIGTGATRRPFVPTEYGKTIWVDTWEKFREAGGSICFSKIRPSLHYPFRSIINFRSVSKIPKHNH